MGNHRPVKVKCWEKFLLENGWSFSRISASHHVWTKANAMRSIVFRGAEKEIPAFHIKTCLKTMGIEVAFFLIWIENNC